MTSTQMSGSQRHQAAEVPELLSRAAAAALARDWQTAADLWATCLSIDPSPAFVVELTLALLKLGRKDEAEQLLRSAFEQYGERPPLLNVYARCAHESKDWHSSVERWSRMLAVSPGHYESLLKRTQAWFELQELEKARAGVDGLQARGLGGADPVFLKLQARLADVEGDGNRALEAWDRFGELQGIEKIPAAPYIGALLLAGKLEDALGRWETLTVKSSERAKLLARMTSLAEIQNNETILDRLRQLAPSSKSKVDAILNGLNAGQSLPKDLQPQKLPDQANAVNPLLTDIERELNAGRAVHAAELIVLLSKNTGARVQIAALLKRLVKVLTPTLLEPALQVMTCADRPWLTMEVARAISDTIWHEHTDRLFKISLGTTISSPASAKDWLTYAKHSIKLGDVITAERSLREIINLQPENVKALIILLTLYQNTGALEAGDDLASRLREIGGASALLATATYHFQARRYSLAQEILHSLDENMPPLQVLPLLADIARAQMRFSLELEYRSQIVALQPNAKALIALSQTEQALGLASAAAVTLEKALALEPLNFQAYSELMQVDPVRAEPYSSPSPRTAHLLQGVMFRVQKLIALNDPEEALGLLESARVTWPADAAVERLRGAMLRALGRLDEAVEAYTGFLELFPLSGRAVADLALIYCDLQRYEQAAALLDTYAHLFRMGAARVLEATIRREIGIGLVDLRSVWSSYRAPAVAQALSCFPDQVRHITDLDGFDKDSHILLLASYGIGDELRWSSVYPDLTRQFSKVSATCDPRLHALFSRSFPKIDFLPTHRKMRDTLSGDAYRRYDQLPDQLLCSLFDNVGWDRAVAADGVLLVSEALLAYRQDTSDFPKCPKLLKSDVRLRRRWRSRLDRLTPGLNVGISWRSSVVNVTRDVHYTSLSDWFPILSIPGINFINLQYDQPLEELSTASKDFGVDVIHFQDLDLKDDFDGLAALVSQLDVVLAPCTALAELSGAIGTKTLLMSNSPVMKWRDRDGLSDVWFSRISLVYGDTWFDKHSLILNTAARVAALAKEKVQAKPKLKTVPQRDRKARAGKEKATT